MAHTSGALLLAAALLLASSVTAFQVLPGPKNNKPQGNNKPPVLPGPKPNKPPNKPPNNNKPKPGNKPPDANPQVLPAPPANDPINKLDDTKTIPKFAAKRMRDRIKAAGGCNANVCFALDGSSRITPRAFRNQVNFVLDIVSVIAVDNPVELAAIQYATRRNRISPLTVEVDTFILAMNNTWQRGGLSRTKAGIAFCANQLSRRWGEANKIVLLGDGYTSVGGWPVGRARRFIRQQGGDISAVKVGKDFNQNALLQIVDGRTDRVFDVNNFFDVLKIQQVVENLVSEICEVEGKNGFPVPKRFRRNRSALRRRRRQNRRRRRRRWQRWCRRRPYRCNWVDGRPF